MIDSYISKQIESDYDFSKKIETLLLSMGEEIQVFLVEKFEKEVEALHRDFSSILKVYVGLWENCQQSRESKAYAEKYYRENIKVSKEVYYYRVANTLQTLVLLSKKSDCFLEKILMLFEKEGSHFDNRGIFPLTPDIKTIKLESSKLGLAILLKTEQTHLKLVFDERLTVEEVYNLLLKIRELLI